MKRLMMICGLLALPLVQAQETAPEQAFWQNLQQHCGKAYEGQLDPDIKNDDFANKKLVMHVKSCTPTQIKIPFYVGDDYSRTWILTMKDNRIELKHDHRMKDGSEDKVTMYGGTATNGGFKDFQMFPADQETADRINYASTNVWWITLNKEAYTYNLQKAGSSKKFTVSFDVTKEVKAPKEPWGWNKKLK